jgi:hypothetical protein
MKTLMKIVGGLVVCLILLLVVLRITGLEPKNRRPGLWLTGNLVTTPVTDWSFTDKIHNIELQTETSYGLPHSVTINCIRVNDQLYFVSTYPPGVHRGWNDNVTRYPNVRMKIGDNVYDRTVAVVTDPAEEQAVLQARAKKYPELKIPPGSTIHIFHLMG